MKHLYFLLAILVTTSIAQIVKSDEALLNINEAVGLAIENDPMLASIAERRRAMQDISVAEGQLPDPRIKFATANVPATSFDPNQEPMTQFQFGLSQRFPRGDTRRLRTTRADAKADLASRQQAARLLATVLEVRQAWLEVSYWSQAAAILREQKATLEDLVDVTQAHYGEGRGQQQDVLRAQLELGLLQDKLLETDRQLENARATLARWVGVEHAARPVDFEAVMLTPIVDLGQLGRKIPDHPVIGIQDAEINIQNSEVGLARQAYKPEWGVDVTYGARASDPLGRSRADFVSVMVNLDVPLFTDKRQDKRLSAARRNEAASRLERDEHVRQLQQMFATASSDWQHTGERLTLYQSEILSDSTQTYDVTLEAYRNEVTSFALVIRARLLEFDTQLKALRLSTDHLKAQARLLYLQGEEE